VTPQEILGKATQDCILRVFGIPEQFGAFTPAADFVNLARALSQHFLPLVAEGRIVSSPGSAKSRAGAFDYNLGRSRGQRVTLRTIWRNDRRHPF